MTFDKHNQHSNGQLAFLPWDPDADTILNKRPVTLMVAPPGCSYLPNENDNEHTLAAKLWTKKKVGIAPDSSVYQKGIRMKRTSQCGLQLHVASTFIQHWERHC